MYIAWSNSDHLLCFVDSHIHVCSFAESQYFVDLSECYSIQQLVEKVKFHVEKYPDLPWITGVNWDQTKLGRFPTRHDLANIDTTKPVSFIFLTLSYILQHTDNYVIIDISISRLLAYWCGEQCSIDLCSYSRS